jgi:hypothetical protein
MSSAEEAAVAEGLAQAERGEFASDRPHRRALETPWPLIGRAQAFAARGFRR